MVSGDMSMVYVLAVELAVSLGAVNIKDLPGCWEHDIDGRWRVALNGHAEAVEAGGGENMAVPVPPYEAAFWYNGWLAGIIPPFGGGVLAAGEGANEDTLCAALQAAIKEPKQ